MLCNVIFFNYILTALWVGGNRARTMGDPAGSPLSTWCFPIAECSGYSWVFGYSSSVCHLYVTYCGPKYYLLSMCYTLCVTYLVCVTYVYAPYFCMCYLLSNCHNLPLLVLVLLPNFELDLVTFPELSWTALHHGSGVVKLIVNYSVVVKQTGNRSFY